MAQPGTPLNEGLLANFVGELAKAGALIAPQIGPEQLQRWSRDNSHLLQMVLIEALRRPALPSKPQPVELSTYWQIRDESGPECEEYLKSLENKDLFEITGFGKKLFDLALSLPRDTRQTRYTLCTPHQLGFRHTEYYDPLISWIMANHNLLLCSRLAGPIICAMTTYQATEPSLFVAMQPLAYRRNIKLTFKLGCNSGKRMLDARPTRNLTITPYQKLLFALQPS